MDYFISTRKCCHTAPAYALRQAHFVHDVTTVAVIQRFRFLPGPMQTGESAVEIRGRVQTKKFIDDILGL